MIRRPRIDDLHSLAVPEQPALSAHGELVYVLRTLDMDADRTDRVLWRVRDGGAPQRLTTGHQDSSPAWSPDGTRLAFLRTPADEAGAPQLWLLLADGGEPEQLTRLPLGAGAPVWSPDGARIAFTASVDLAAAEGEDDAARRQRAAAPFVASRLDYQADGSGFLRSVRSHIHVLDLTDRQCRRATGGDWHAGVPAWSPDGTRLAFAAATHPDADLTLHVPLHVVDADDEQASIRQVGPADLCAGPVTWTADGRQLLTVGTPGGPGGHARLLRVPLDGGAPIDLAAPLDRNVMPGGTGYPGAAPQLTDDGRTVLFCARDRGCTHLYAVDVTGGCLRRVLGGTGDVVFGLSAAAGMAAVALTTQTSYGEIVTVDLAGGPVRVRTGHGAPLAEVTPYPRVEREFTVSDGTRVAGWLIRDPGASGPQPLLLDIHGGPHNAWNAAADEVHLYHQELVARGWTVLLLNPRGSDGYGERFYTAVVGAWGKADAADFLEPLDDLVTEGVADPRRLAVAGYSYGGYMTCYLTSRDSRFAAAVAGGPVTDPVSMAGSSDEGHHLAVHEFGGPPWSSGDGLAAMSPLARVGQVHTPTLILHGTADLCCPVGQAQQWFTALRERGVPSRLVLYPNASHTFIVDGRPSHRLDFNRRIVDWMSQHVHTVEEH
ncbi:dipeptidyl aminopeptidase/acylaminoacyl peptidase [Streptomyces sp. Ag109_O5-1]|uniref:S9 family peptidase n=1 Tax=Streptomyces sp. Ag109_O5-1 TaxID=1938851 RepID=UPI000F4D3766|nr:S9 family peptidase [Streptomyces sp. Ag109_O5-1]RPE39199.1 dipeptidyl aminopeptidase/acylaminoacyl peptidase [Streptomyces sp. Ag109_O5-1]